MASHGSVSFFDLAKFISKFLNFDPIIKILPANQSEISANDIAKRPEYLVMSNSRLQKEGLDFQLPWEISLIKYLSHNYFLRKN
jgi:dTDP-4-dehydrorhamnose reductase